MSADPCAGVQARYGAARGFTGIFLIRGVWLALVAILNPVHPWDNIRHWRAPVTHAIAVKPDQLMIVVVVIGGIMRLLKRVF